MPIKKRKMYLVTYGEGELGKALMGLTNLGITREIKCCPNNQLLLWEDELEGLRELGVKEKKAVEAI